MADLNWKVVRCFVAERFGIRLGRSSCHNYLHLRLVHLPAYSPDFNADEHIWAWLREEVTANTCFDTAANVRAHIDPLFAWLATRTAEVRQ